MIRHLLKLVWRRKRLNALLVVEIFFSFLVVFAVVTAALVLWNNYRKPLGFDHRDIWNVRIDFNRDEMLQMDAGGMEQLAVVVREARSIPGVLAVAAAQDVPYDGSTSIHTTDQTGHLLAIQISDVTDAFADVLRVPVVAGRWFEESDGVQPWEPAVINRHLARELFGEEDALGKNLPILRGDRALRIVGIVDDYRKGGEFVATVPYLFQRTRLDAPGGRAARNLLLRVAPGVDVSLEEEIADRLQAVAPGWSFEVRSLSAMRDTNLRLTLAPLLAGGVIAGFLMVMVGLGLIGVLWQNVTQRTREIGLRRASGASARQVRRQILAELWVLAGLAMALGAALLVQLPILDLASFLSGGVLLAGIAISGVIILALATASGLYPSWLATRIHPAEALHYE